MVFSTTSRSREPGARTSSVIRRLDDQYWRSTSMTRRSSAKLRSSTGKSGRTTMAIGSDSAGRACGVQEVINPITTGTIARRRLRFFTKVLILEGKARLCEDAIDRRQVAPRIVAILHFKRRECREIIPDARRGAGERWNDRPEDRVRLRHVYLLEPVVRFPHLAKPR